MGELDGWNDDRLAATLALAERIAGDLAALVAGLRGDPPPNPAPDDGIREGQWRLLDEMPYRVGRETRPGTREAWFHGLKSARHAWLDAVIVKDPIIPAPPDATAVWAKPRKGQRLWDAGNGTWLTAMDHFENWDGMGVIAEETGYPREAGPWRWCEPVAEKPAPQPKFPVPTWAKHRVDPWPCLLVSKGNGTVRVFYTSGQESKYLPDAESEWTACEDPLAALTAALAKER